MKLKAPFPYFGGKRSVSDLVWSRLGNPNNYVEPFAGSLAVLLGRPGVGKVETVNDRNHYVVNFWRSVTNDPDGVVEFADWPVTEADLHARHSWLVSGNLSEDFRESIRTDPDFYDVRFAGWWVWGQCCWIGGGWCDSYGSTSDGGRKSQMPEICQGRGIQSQSKQVPDLSGDSGATGRGVVASAGHNKRPVLRSDAETRCVVSLGKKLPNLDTRGEKRGVVSYGKKPITALGNSQFLPGVHGESTQWQSRPTLKDRGINTGGGRPQLGDEFDIGRGVNSNKHAGTCEERRTWLRDWISNRLSDRLRLVRTCYGDWNRICNSKTTMDRHGVTGAFLDPPYAKNIDRLHAFIDGKIPAEASATNRASELYSGDAEQDIDRLVADVHLWCVRWGKNPKVRIALCGYDGEHNALVSEHGWDVVEWKAHGGYANRNAENKNKFRERIWFSPACVGKERSLFDMGDPGE